jgi:LytS/YehU family sensor histidine kinase
VYVNYMNRTASYNHLQPGNYTFYADIKSGDGSWSSDNVKLNIYIIPAWWQTGWFKVLFILIGSIAVYMFVHWRIKGVRKQEQLKGKYEKELLELEARALRSQMNPHFIFNCMNSIKSLIQQRDDDNAINYLTTFSKLIRTIFQNSDKREITLYDEIETCRLYTQLESMRFNNKFSYKFDINKTLDLKSIMVPALIVQPFIENSIRHGIMPKKDGGHVKITIDKTGDTIYCSIDDNGIGREISKQNKFRSIDSIHESKGEYLTQARLDLDNLLNERNAKIEIIDKVNENGNSGTTVILSFQEY